MIFVMKKDLQNLQIALKKHKESEWENLSQPFMISEELYSTLCWEYEKLKKLKSLIEDFRTQWIVEVLFEKDIFSDQIDEFPVPKKWFSKQFLDMMRDYASYKYWRKDEYEGYITDKMFDDFVKRLQRFKVRDLDLPGKRDVFQEISKGQIVSYELLEECSKSELFAWLTEILGKNSDLSSFVINPFQIEYLHRKWLLQTKTPYIIFCKVKWEIIPFKISLSYASYHFCPAAWGRNNRIKQEGNKTYLLLNFPEVEIEKSMKLKKNKNQKPLEDFF